MKNLKNMKLPPIGDEKPLEFLKQGRDLEFENAMATIGTMYDDIFKSDVNFNEIFENIKVDNNPILDPISDMMNQIFDPNDVKDHRQYQKLSPEEAQLYKERQNQLALRGQEDEESELVLGESVDLHSEDNWNYKL